MTQEEITFFLGNMKLIFQHGVSHSKSKSKLHRFLAIHNCHYVLEQIIRERAKNMSFNMTFDDALHKINFEEIIKRIHKKEEIPDYDRLLELNKIRNNAEHFFIIPDSETVSFYIRIVGDFLKWSYKEYFGVDYESLTFEDMIYDAPIRKAMLEAKTSIEKEDLPSASQKMYEALGLFKVLWFGFLLDIRVAGIYFEQKLDFPNILADLAFKIILSEDEATLEKFQSINIMVREESGKIAGFYFNYLVPVTFKDKEEATRQFEDILNIILTYQDRVPSNAWRKE